VIEVRFRDEFPINLDPVEVVQLGIGQREYSPYADVMPGQIPETVKSERLTRLQAAIRRHQTAFNARCVGCDLDVLMEKPGRDPGQLTGRSPYLQPVQVMAEKAVRSLILNLEGKGSESGQTHIDIKPQLIVRGSTAPPPTGGAQS